MAKILIIGCGEIGYRVALALHHQGHHVVGFKRQPPVNERPFAMISADICRASTLSVLAVDFDVVLFIVSPDRRQEQNYQLVFETGLNNLISHFAKANKSPKWLMVSSTSVYGQNQGEWVDETSATQPGNACGRWLVSAEKHLWALNPQNCVVRFSGIYGPGRDRLLRLTAGSEHVQFEPPLFTNRIHQNDCVAVLLFLLEKQLAGNLQDSCYLASDDEPAPLWDVMLWIAEQYGYPEPLAANSRPQAQQNKRCSNARLKALGYRFLYPGYRDGYRP